jgi:hypothetical protein
MSTRNAKNSISILQRILCAWSYIYVYLYVMVLPIVRADVWKCYINNKRFVCNAWGLCRGRVSGQSMRPLNFTRAPGNSKFEIKIRLIDRFMFTWARSRCTLFLNNFISIKLSSTCFEQIIVHHQEVCTSSLQYFTVHLIRSLVADTVGLIPCHRLDSFRPT